MDLFMCWLYPIPCQRGPKMYLNLCWSKPNHVSEETKYFIKCIDQNPHMTERIQNIILHVLTKPLLCQRARKMHINMGWLNSLHASDDTKCISTCVDQTHTMPVRTQNVSQHLLTKPNPCQRGRKMKLNMCWPITTHASEDAKCISTRIDQRNPMAANSEYASQHVMTKPIPFQREH